MCLFGGNITNETQANYKKKMGSDLDEGHLYTNFNDYYCSFISLFCITFGGWNDIDQVLMFDNLDRYNKPYYEYYFIIFFMFANLCLMNVVVSFFVDNVMAAIGEIPVDGIEENPPEDDEIPGGAIELDMVQNNDGGDREMKENKPMFDVDVKVDLDVNPDIEVEVDLEVDPLNPTVELELDAPDVEVELEGKIPDVELEVDLEAPQVDAEVEVGLDVQVNPDDIGEPDDIEIEAEIDVNLEL